MLHEQALKIELADIRLLNLLPSDVQILSVLPHPERQQYRDAWYPSHPPDPLFLHIRHGYCQARYARAPLCYEDLTKFLERYKVLKEMGDICPVCSGNKVVKNELV